MFYTYNTLDTSRVQSCHSQSPEKSLHHPTPGSIATQEGVSKMFSPWCQTNTYPSTAGKSYQPQFYMSKLKVITCPQACPLLACCVCGMYPAANHPILDYSLSLPFSLALRPSLQLPVSWFCSPFCTPLSFLGAGPHVLLEWPLNHPQSSAVLHQPILDTSVRSPEENTI